eukprot:TRINITY_DN20733_c0_g1_i1.p1 TRINITY_DN20733_c0_g1~~TRINITY_DN20733_c0_g1_i1.p1  ORF type:complete len:231 (+),score=24.56 TRINITY_DN20733_c0_g1_i1:74-766(+)
MIAMASIWRPIFHCRSIKNVAWIDVRPLASSSLLGDVAASGALVSPASSAGGAFADAPSTPSGPRAFAPLHDLQAAYDEILAHPSRFPLHVQRVHHLAREEQRRRQEIVDQSSLGAGCEALFTARKVIYVITGRNDTRFQVCATRFSCAQDFLERFAKSHGKKRGFGRWLASHGFGNIFVYTVESLQSEQTPYNRIAHRRLKRWSEVLEDVQSGREVLDRCDGDFATRVE